MRVEGMLRRFHVACTEFLYHFRPGESLGNVITEAIGIAAPNHWIH